MNPHVESPETLLGGALMRMVAAAGVDTRLTDNPVAGLRLLTEEGARLIAGTDDAVCVLDGDDRVQVAAASGRLRGLEGVTSPAAADLVGRALASDGPIVEAPDPATQPVLGAPLQRSGACSVYAVALPSRGLLPERNLGVYIAARFDATAFSPRELDVLAAYSELIRLSLLRTRQHQEEERYTRRLRLGLDLALDLSTATGPDEVNQRLLDRAMQALEADRATLLRLDLPDVCVESEQDMDGRAVMPGFRFALDSQPAFRLAVSTRKPTREGLLAVAAFPEPLQQALGDVKHMVLMPLIFGGDVLGFLNAHRRRDIAFAEDDVATLQLIGTVAAVMLRNSRLLADTQSARQAMSDFLHIVIHEMRAPLTIITGYVSMLQEGVFGRPPAEWERPLNTVDEKLREAQQLVDELLTAARFESGRLPVQVEDCDMAEAVRRAVKRAQPRAELQKASVEAETPNHLWARADREHIDRILDNLINNALTHGGSPPLVRVHAHDGATPTVVVEDNGDGVAAGDRERIFERFYRGKGSMSGSGLGLYIGRQLAQACGCRLELGDGGSGARFILMCPATAADAAELAGSRAQLTG